MPETSIRRRLSFLSQLALGGYWLTMFVLTHVPPETRFLPPQFWDKVYHAIGYALLAGLFAITWQLSAEYLTTRHLRMVWFVVVAYAAIDELSQIPVGRTCSIWDWLADAIGAAVGLAIFVWLRRRWGGALI